MGSCNNKPIVTSLLPLIDLVSICNNDSIITVIVICNDGQVIRNVKTEAIT